MTATHDDLFTGHFAVFLATTEPRTWQARGPERKTVDEAKADAKRANGAAVATYNPAEVERLIAEARRQYKLVEVQGYGVRAGTMHDIADQLEAARARIDNLEAGLRDACDHIDDLHLPDPGLRAESIRLRAVAPGLARRSARSRGLGRARGRREDGEVAQRLRFVTHLHAFRLALRLAMAILRT